MKLFNLRFLRIWIKYYFSKYSRYRHLYWIIINLRPKSILEIGVYKAIRANEMIYLASNFYNSISYYGFDLFDKMNNKKINLELSKNPLSINVLQKKLLKHNKNIKINLTQGDTVRTLKNFIKLKKKIDLIFIDGGHSIKTIQSDWNNIKKIMTNKTVVIFDDYYHDNVITKKYGCNKTIKNLGNKYDYKILPSSDYIKFKKRKIKNSLVRVIRKTSNISY